MSDRLREVKKKQTQAKANRKKGDALRRIGRNDEAKKAYLAGFAAIKDALEILRPDLEQIISMSPPLTGELEMALDELIEIFGSQGGLLLRLRMLKEASESYSEGAVLEEQFSLPSTYNRLNAIKSSLLTGDNRLRDLEPQIKMLATQIETNLRADKSLNDSGWAWADLGDCLALLSKPEEAYKAYSSFISKAEIKSPERTLDILKEIASKLKELGDPDQPRLQVAIDVLQGSLVAH